MHGFASGSVYMQDSSLGPSEGQQSLFANATQPKTDKMSFGGDVRQSRFNFSVSGPKVLGGATPKAVLEIDWFQGFGGGNYGNVSLLPRMRLAYAEIGFSNQRIAAGQLIDLIFALAPTSLAHIAFPVGYGAGNIGWRRPGLWGFHKFGDEVTFEFAWEIGRSQWADAGAPYVAGTGATAVNTNATIGQNAYPGAYGISLAEASALPAVEARATVAAGKLLSVFVAGHWNRVDFNGLGEAATTTPNSDLDVIAGVAGLKLTAGPLTVAATGFTGKNLAPLVGNFFGFQSKPVDIHEIGGWVNAGFNFTKELSLWGFVGTEKPNDNETLAAGFTRIRNVTTGGMLQYRDGGWAAGLEWYHFHTDYTTAAGAVDGNQWLLTSNYFF